MKGGQEHIAVILEKRKVKRERCPSLISGIHDWLSCPGSLRDLG